MTWRATSDPETKLSVWKRSQLQEIEDAKTPESAEEVRNRHDLRIDMLGGGSDHAPFINFAGVASFGNRVWWRRRRRNLPLDL